MVDGSTGIREIRVVGDGPVGEDAESLDERPDNILKGVRP
jgi:hypothetical protein